MWRILQCERPDDFVLATGKSHSIREFVQYTFQALDDEIVWEGEGIDEIGVLKSTGKVVIRINPKHFRPTEVDLLLGDASKAEKELKWKAKVGIKKLVEIMVKHDFESLKNGI